jgi:hypothetical protein
MQPTAFALVLLFTFPAGRALAEEPEKPVELLRTEAIAALKKFDSDPMKKKEAERQLRAELSKIVDKYSEKLRPAEGSKKHVSADKSFVLVIAANGLNGKDGERAEADDADAKLVLAVGGNGSPAAVGRQASGGGFARAKASGGVALALGGRGGAGGRKLGGGGGGGGSDATGDIGSVGLGGNGGDGFGFVGGIGGCKIVKPDAIIKAMKELK